MRCGSELIEGRIQTGAHLGIFVPAEDEKKLKPRHSEIICNACPSCGAICDIRLKDPEKIR